MALVLALTIAVLQAAAVAVAAQVPLSQQRCFISPQQITPDKDQQASLFTQCSGRHGVKMPVPWDCQQYVVCCSGTPLTFSCLPPWDHKYDYYFVSDEQGKHAGVKFMVNIKLTGLKNIGDSPTQGRK